MKTLVIGTGFVGSILCEFLKGEGIEVTQSSRRQGCANVTIGNGADLDRVLSGQSFNQVVVVGQLTSENIDWVLERIDGSRWVIVSSQQLASSTPAPGAAVALAREEFAMACGACVLRPTMIFGRGGDLNISRVVRLMRRLRFPVIPGHGDQMVQPLHVDDLCELIIGHGRTPEGGIYPAGGLEALPLRELILLLAELIGLRTPPVEIPSRLISGAKLLGPLVGLRSDQLGRLIETRIADNSLAAAVFGWAPAPVGIRLEQAVLHVPRYRPRWRGSRGGCHQSDCRGA